MTKREKEILSSIIHDIDRKTLRDIIGDVSKWSYIHGSNDFEKVIRNHHILTPKSK